jgi:hypothetical protein
MAKLKVKASAAVLAAAHGVRPEDTRPVTTGAHQANPTSFKPGQSGNPAGRPKGSRHKLSVDFIAALHDDFEVNGVAAIVRVRETDPTAYVRVIASLLPKEVKVQTASDLTDEQLDAQIHRIAAELGYAMVGLPTAND